MNKDTYHKGIVYLVGAGPGDPELMTIKARRLVQSCDAIVYDALVAPEILGWARRGCERIYVGKEPGRHTQPQEIIQEILSTLAEAGKTVVRLKGGDPFIFGRGGEEAAHLVERGIRYEVVPAVTAALAASAAAGIPLTHRNLSRGLIFLSGHEAEDSDNQINWRAYSRLDVTLCLYMAMGRLNYITNELCAGGMDREMPAAVVQWAGTPRQRVCTGLVGNLAQRAEAEGIGRPGIVIIGRVAALHDALKSFVNSEISDILETIPSH